MSSQTQPTQLSADQAKACLQFLQRAQLQGAEMPAFVSIFNSLSAIVSADNVDEEHTALNEDAG